MRPPPQRAGRRRGAGVRWAAEAAAAPVLAWLLLAAGPAAGLVVEHPCCASHLHVPAAFGPDLLEAPLRGRELVVVEPADGCGELAAGLDLKGKVALIRRGGCNFTDKVLRAQQREAAAAIVYDAQDRERWGTIMSGVEEWAQRVTIPSVFVSYATGLALRNASLALAAAAAAGAGAGGASEGADGGATRAAVLVTLNDTGHVKPKTKQIGPVETLATYVVVSLVLLSFSGCCGLLLALCVTCYQRAFRQRALRGLRVYTYVRRKKPKAKPSSKSKAAAAATAAASAASRLRGGAGEGETAPDPAPAAAAAIPAAAAAMPAAAAGLAAAGGSNSTTAPAAAPAMPSSLLARSSSASSSSSSSSSSSPSSSPAPGRLPALSKAWETMASFVGQRRLIKWRGWPGRGEPGRGASSSSSSSSSAAGGGSRRRADGGRDDAWSEDEEETTCPICLDQYEDGDRLTVLPCSHSYHDACIKPWLIEKSEACPKCRRPAFHSPLRARGGAGAGLGMRGLGHNHQQFLAGAGAGAGAGQAEPDERRSRWDYAPPLDAAALDELYIWVLNNLSLFAMGLVAVITSAFLLGAVAILTPKD